MNKAEKILRKIEKKANNEFLPIVGPEKGQVLAEEVRRAKPKRVLEVGTLVGYSAILMGNELDETAYITTVEIHKEEARTAEENIRKAEIPPKVEVITGDAIEIIPQLKDAFDFVFIDAMKNEYKDYLRLVENKLCEGAMIVADNAGIFAKQMTDYLEYVRRSGKYNSKYVPVGNDGLEITVKL
ncbi:MAG: class I SAM-dependent methyltransferase [Candidatus Bathyarchaeia archaeon]|nr:class I SAM-dependent methyltransferase [Candidatus Bathyarchaeia archaeon]